MSPVRKADFIGKTVLIGLTYFEADGTFIEQKQLFGTITTFDREIEILLDNGEKFSLPPDSSAMEPAARGEYRLRSTGKIITDPDYLCTYSITNPVKH